MTESQNVLNYQGNNTIFLVWLFKPQVEVKAAFMRVCRLFCPFRYLYFSGGRRRYLMGKTKSISRELSITWKCISLKKT
ncbi:hypothetical protein SAMN04488128_103250 [Chitinophaga eiseniae]|uniref:Uncharacterized protein n=1 Tax=Chitinophaga eiseniae TaxID=634771 RepID=A0A1T4SPW5_9BACT|nr:hypothetical protein SAMN04488128_103250 [Chitinophaga eiseniae]